MCIIRVKSRHRFGHGAILSPLARTDCWGCALRHGVNTVRPLRGVGWRSLSTTRLQGVRGLPCYPHDARGGRAPTLHAVYCMITMHGGERLCAGGIDIPHGYRLQTVPWLPILTLRGKQQGLGTKLSHAKNRGRPSCACAWPPKHNPDRQDADYSRPTPRAWFRFVFPSFQAPELKPGTTRSVGWGPLTIALATSLARGTHCKNK
jgi:hypothetical protein